MATYKEMTRKFNDISNNSRYCPYCGHTITLSSQVAKRVGMYECNYCRRTTYLDPKVEFKEKLKRAIRKAKENERENKA